MVVIDWMPIRGDVPDFFRVVEGRRRRVPMRTELTILDYCSLVPWVRRAEDGRPAVGGANLIRARTPVALRGQKLPLSARCADARPLIYRKYPSSFDSEG